VKGAISTENNRSEAKVFKTGKNLGKFKWNFFKPKISVPGKLSLYSTALPSFRRPKFDLKLDSPARIHQTSFKIIFIGDTSVGKSSFSSSEERLLECKGLILNLPLTPHRFCTPKRESDHSTASFANTVTYR